MRDSHLLDHELIHSNPVSCTSFSPDGTCIATGSEDTTVRLIDPATGEVRRVVETGHTEPIRSVSFGPDGTCIATGSGDRTIGSGDKTVRLIDAATGEVLQLGDELHVRPGTALRPPPPQPPQQQPVVHSAASIAAALAAVAAMGADGLPAPSIMLRRRETERRHQR